MQSEISLHKKPMSSFYADGMWVKGVDGRGASVALTGWMHDTEYSLQPLRP